MCISYIYIYTVYIYICIHIIDTHTKEKGVERLKKMPSCFFCSFPRNSNPGLCKWHFRLQRYEERGKTLEVGATSTAGSLWVIPWILRFRSDFSDWLDAKTLRPWCCNLVLKKYIPGGEAFLRGCF